MGRAGTAPAAPTSTDGAACLPSATKQPHHLSPRDERNQVSNVYKPIWTGWDAAQASAQKKVHIFWYKYFGLPPPRQPTGSSTGSTAAALLRAESGKRLIPTATNVCCNKSPHTLTWLPTCLPGIATKERGFWQSGARLAVPGRCCFPKNLSNCHTEDHGDAL